MKLSRRQLLLGGAGLAGAAGLGLTAAGCAPGETSTAAGGGASSSEPIAFRGDHQSGILTPAQQQMLMVSFDMVADRREDLIALLEDWTLAAERMQAGQPVNDPSVSENKPPDDTGEAYDLGPSDLTVTFGFGPTLFDDPDDGDRFGIKSKMPKYLKDGIPRMAAEAIDQTKSHGDLIIQICAEDPMVVLHAMHQFKRIAFGTATVRWMQLGYGRTSSTSTEQETPRNLFGFKDGTSNIKAEDTQDELDKHLWIQADDDQGGWAEAGTYLCVRKIHMMMEVWDELILSEQEVTIGRDKLKGAPLSGGEEFDDPDFTATDDKGEPLMPVDAHVTIVHPDNNNGARMLRRGYNYTEGLTDLGRLDAGLFFIAFVRNPSTNFIPILRKMADDAMTEYLQHTATGLYLIPGGIREGDTYVGQRLLEA